MKKYFLILMVLALVFTSFFAVGASAETESGIKAYYTIDAKSGYVIEGSNIEHHLPIASMVKIMTALLTFENVESGTISLDEKVIISENASSMGGSQMFIEQGDEYTISDLLKGVIVVSANDASVQLAERIKGSEEEFVKLMNEKAKSLGMNNTNFVNCTGLPKRGQYSCARDVAVMLKELIKHEKYHEYSKIWIEDYTHPDGRITQFVNTNKLVRFYKDCTGGKTGFTNEAGFCLAASARRDGSDIISVVIGASNSKGRFNFIKKQFENAFINYETKNVLDKDVTENVQVIAGKEEKVSVAPEKGYFKFVKKGDKSNVEVRVELIESVKAPVQKGQVLGKIYLIDGQKEEIINLLAVSDVQALNYGEIVDKVIDLW